MARWRILASLVVAFVATGNLQAQTVNLQEAPLPGSHFRVELNMKLDGELTLQQAGKDIAIKESATATHDYLERFLDAGGEGIALRSARVYKAAKVNLVVGNDKLERTLRPDRTFLVAQRGRDGLLIYSPRGAMTREEMDVTDHLDSLVIAGLLPDKEIAVGSTWKVSNGTVQALCHLQGLSEQTLTGKLESVAGDEATLSFTGTAAGIDLGAPTAVVIKGTAKFSTKARRVTSLEWTQTDTRGQGPVSPGSKVEVTTRMTRTPIEPCNELNDVVLVPVPNGQPPREMVELQLTDARGRNELVHAREWLLVGRTEDHTVLRLMDRGDFVAQVSIAPWKKAEPGKHLSPDDVKAIVANTPGWQLEKLLRTEEIKLPSGQWAYLVAGEGDLGDLRAVQYFYFVAGPQGDQAMLTFTMTPAQTQKLGTRDIELLRGFLLPGATREQEVKGQ